MSKEVCVITGVGPGTGTALTKRFSEQYQVAMMARNGNRLAQLESEISNTRAYPCDVSDTHALQRAIKALSEELGPPSVLIHNAVGGSFGDVLAIDPKDLERNFQINTLALLHLIQALGPGMVDAGKGTILATGNTAAYRGAVNYAGFAPSKAAQRVLLESAARALGPRGVHVFYVAIDAIIDVPWARKRFSDKADDFFCKPADIAEECFHITHQPKSTWTFDAVIRPFAEKW